MNESKPVSKATTTNQPSKAPLIAGSVIMTIISFFSAQFYFLLSILNNVIKQIAPATQNARSPVPFKFQPIGISTTTLFFIFIAVLIVLSLIVSFIIGKIQKKDIKYTLKIMLYYAAGSIILFILFTIIWSLIYQLSA